MTNDDFVWYEPADPTPRHLCPCCDYVSLPERGEWLIRPVCYWEDDGQDLDDLDRRSPPNHGLTLREARENFRSFGASKIEMLPHVCPVRDRKAFEYRPRKID